MDTLQYFLLLVILLTLIQPACGKLIVDKGKATAIHLHFKILHASFYLYL